jgi:hypothetical protein
MVEFVKTEREAFGLAWRASVELSRRQCSNHRGWQRRAARRGARNLLGFQVIQLSVAAH